MKQSRKKRFTETDLDFVDVETSKAVDILQRENAVAPFVMNHGKHNQKTHGKGGGGGSSKGKKIGSPSKSLGPAKSKVSLRPAGPGKSSPGSKPAVRSIPKPKKVKSKRKISEVSTKKKSVLAGQLKRGGYKATGSSNGETFYRKGSSVVSLKAGSKGTEVRKETRVD